MSAALTRLTSPKDRRLTGQVVGVDSGVMTVSTSVGVIRCPVAIEGAKLGDTVVVERGTIVGKLKEPSSVPIYYT